MAIWPFQPREKKMFMSWTDALLTGIKDVDTQHKWLVDATNRLHDELSKPQSDPAVVGDILEGLVDYTYNHFIMEEELFERLGYPETAAHKAQHNVFTTKIGDLLLRHESGEVSSGEALELLKDWLIQHIMKTDKAYVPFLQSKGVA
jgi:hemerythrin